VGAVGEFFMVLVITIVGGCIGFVIFILRHEKEHKKEMREKSLREANDNKNRVGQHDKSCDDVLASGGRETTRTTGKTTTPTTPAPSI
jgi:hypothetical protein